MLRASLAFFVLALIALALGAFGIAGVSLEIGRSLLWVFLVLAVLSFVASLVSGRGNPTLPMALAGLSASSLLLFSPFNSAFAASASTEVKKTVRAVKDKACPLVDGKIQCAKDKVINKARNARDEVKDEVKDQEKGG